MNPPGVFPAWGQPLTPPWLPPWEVESRYFQTKTTPSLHYCTNQKQKTRVESPKKTHLRASRALITLKDLSPSPTFQRNPWPFLCSSSGIVDGCRKVHFTHPPKIRGGIQVPPLLCFYFWFPWPTPSLPSLKCRVQLGSTLSKQHRHFTHSSRLASLGTWLLRALYYMTGKADKFIHNHTIMVDNHIVPDGKGWLQEVQPWGGS